MRTRADVVTQPRTLSLSTLLLPNQHRAHHAAPAACSAPLRRQHKVPLVFYMHCDPRWSLYAAASQTERSSITLTSMEVFCGIRGFEHFTVFLLSPSQASSTRILANGLSWTLKRYLLSPWNQAFEASTIVLVGHHCNLLRQPSRRCYLDTELSA